MQNARLDESQAGINTAWRNNNLSFADDTTWMAENEGELRSLLMQVKEESEKDGLKLNTHKTMIMASNPITAWQIKGEKWKHWMTIFLDSKIPVDGDCSHENERQLVAPSSIDSSLWFIQPGILHDVLCI